MIFHPGPISLSHFTSVASEVEFISADLPGMGRLPADSNIQPSMHSPIADEARGTGLQSYMIEPHVHVFQLDSVSQMG